MTQVMAGMVTHVGIALAEAPPRQRKRIRRELHTELLRTLNALRRQKQIDRSDYGQECESH
jgi:hypothetical protein